MPVYILNGKIRPVPNVTSGTSGCQIPTDGTIWFTEYDFLLAFYIDLTHSLHHLRLFVPICKTRRFCIPCATRLLAEFGITGYFNPGWLMHAGSQGTDLSCHLLISIFMLHCVITVVWCWKQTDGCHDFSISATCYAVLQHAALNTAAVLHCFPLQQLKVMVYGHDSLGFFFWVLALASHHP